MPAASPAHIWEEPKAVNFASKRGDAAAIGFDDQFIYDEIETPFAARKIPFQQIEVPAAVELFKAWADKPDKKAY